MSDLDVSDDTIEVFELKRETRRKIVLVDSWHGTCDSCQTPLYYESPFPAVLIERTLPDDPDILLPIDIFSCMKCFHTIGKFNSYGKIITWKGEL